VKLEKICIRNFRRLEDVSIAIEDKETVFVGPNNSGKTSATSIFRCFLGKRSFRVHDFSVSKMTEIDAFGADSAVKLPTIELDIWFSIDPNSIEFGRAFSLLPNLSGDFTKLGTRLCFRPTDASKLREAYQATYPLSDQGNRAKRLSEYLGEEGVLNRHFEISYASLAESQDGPVPTLLDPAEGRKLLQNLIRIDFVDAQRNIDDEEGHRSTRLSTAFASYYKNNLEQPEVAAEAHRVIDENNKKLTDHYKDQFQGLMTVIKGLGVPSVNDRDLKIISSLSPDTALRGNTELLYVDGAKNHELPELYNGLGFKNLIYMAIQAKHFHSQWVRTPKDRPLCQIIFIEEPEVHLHAQVQQTFISNIWEVINKSAKTEGAEHLKPQLVVTTHSSHILDATEFGKVRYFRRCPLKTDPAGTRILNATQVHSLRDFQPEPVTIPGQEATSEQALEFLTRYLRLTHCDLFFADAAILVEGAVEKLLLPSMIELAASRLKTSYLTILEIGGAYAHRFDGLLSFLQIPYLIITDLDSVEATGKHPVCRADTPGALTSNASLKKIFNVTAVSELMALTPEQKGMTSTNRFVTFQTDIEVSNTPKFAMRPRTLEEAFCYQNYPSVKAGKITLGITIPEILSDAYELIYAHVKSSSFKKTDFAMMVLASGEAWSAPAYIVEGLQWLEKRLHGEQKEA